MSESIHPETKIGAVYLTVADLNRSLTYYQEGIGLKLQRSEGNTAYLGAGGPDLLALKEQPGARPARGMTGLYHFALLVPSRLELARTLHHLIASQTRIGGASDHAVSEALYLTDPDGHGIEIYRDRPRSAWQHPGGQLRMVTEPLDLPGVLGELNGSDEQTWTGLHPQTIMGHIHLHVAYLAEAENFYRNVLGFDVMARYGSAASFLSAGGYHHHLGMNTWAGVGAPAPPSDVARLLWYEIRLPDSAALLQVINRVQAAGLPVTEEDGGFYVQDPSKNRILLTAS
jgi:catechol 2,3-dioxygenase